MSEAELATMISYNEGLKQLIPELNFTPDYLRVWNEIKRVEKFIKKYQ